MLTVTVNDRPLDVAAIRQNGRVMVPMRATFAALGATVRFDPQRGIIVARAQDHAMQLRVGSQRALVDDRTVGLDAAPEVVANTLYVPLRFVAQSLGAIVGYHSRANIVSIVSAISAGAVRLQAVTPEPGSVASTAYPTISASLGGEVASSGDVTLTIDGTDVTPLASFDGSTITYMPRTGLSRGEHTVVFAGRTHSGASFSLPWSFETSLEAAPDAPPLSSYNYQFYADGPSMYQSGDWMHFVLVAPPGGSAELQLCGLGYQYALWNGGSGTMYAADFPAPTGFYIPSCPVTATYTSWNGRQFFVPVPVTIGLYTGPHPLQPTPAPSFKPRPLPGEPRRSEPTPAPTPAPTAASQPRPVQTHAPIPIHVPPVHPPPHPMPRRTP